MNTYAEINKTNNTPKTANKFLGNNSFIQPKLTINAPNDTYEQEADAVSDKVMRMEKPSIQTSSMAISSLQRKCAHCEEEEKKMQRKEMNGEEANADSSLENYVGNLSGGGQPLSNEVRSFYEPRFGYDFSNVKVHTDSVAAKSAQSINALAYTSGNNIVFNNSQYAPDTDTGKRLLGHELTHVVQQGHGVSTKIQKVGDLTKVPPMACDVANTSPPASALTSLFPTSATSLSADQRNNIAIFVTSWQASGGTDPLRVDGYASPPGADEMNWQLSCDRALSVANELRNNGVPDAMIEILAQGETNEFGADANNQRADISMTGPPGPPEPPACAAGKDAEKMTACIQPIVIADDDGKNPTVAPSFAQVTSIWSKCCIDYTINATQTINKTDYKILDESPTNTPTAEETSLFTDAGASTCIQVFVPQTFAQGGKTGKEISGGGGTYDAGTANPKIVVVEGAVSEVVAHEVGHASGFLGHDANTTVMKPTGAFDSPNSTNVSADVCSQSRTGSALTKAGVKKDCCMNF